MHVHLENYTSKPRVFWLTPELARAARRSHPRLEVRFTVGDDLRDLERQLSSARVLVTSADVIRDPRFPRGRLAQAAPHLELVHLIGAGVEGVLPLDWLPPRVRLTNNSGVHADKAREFLLMALLALNARLPAIIANQRLVRWEQIFTPRIRGKTLAVVGLGNMGRAAVRAGTQLGLRMIGVRRSGRGMAGVEHVYRPAQLRAALKGADFLVIAAPLTPQTAGLIDHAALRCMKRGAGVINIGRAGILEHEALVELLSAGHLGGAILDVLPAEPLPASSVLWSAPNLIVFPHVSSDDADRYMLDTLDLVCRNIKRLRARRPVQNVVNPDHGY
jgi:phosphoglycerate dehydrogenase-like enzyme